MNKKIESQFAIGIILLVAMIFGGIIWLNNARRNSENKQTIALTNSLKNQPEPQKTTDVVLPAADQDCKPHYYEGKAQIKEWIVPSDQNDSSDVVIQLKDGEEKKLPVTNLESNGNFTVKLIDPTDAIKKQLSGSTQEKPATITVRGYAEICKQPPLVSLKQATIAFKKS